MPGPDDDLRLAPSSAAPGPADSLGAGKSPGAAPALRASDADRERTAEALRRHTADGRLTPDELEERLGEAYGARTTADLERLTVDLPAVVPAAPPAQAPRTVEDEEARAELRAHLLQRGGGAAAISLVCVVIWFAAGMSGSFWPIWVILGTGAGVGATWWRGLGPGGDPVRELERADEREDRRRYHDPHRKRGGPHF